jgi:hypothetical protein
MRPLKKLSRITPSLILIAFNCTRISAEAQPPKHWAYKKPVRVRPQLTAQYSNPIDAFIHAKLRDAGLEPSEPAGPVTLIRRLFLDMHGLPPTPGQVRNFVNSKDSKKYEKFVGRILASPRYGERWAQHWLDIVRYADTHGFEVNTPRPNAWPYRDYVIRALNEDKPYDRFVFEQLAGDSTDEDAATGFLVAAAVLLPGQIGQDAPSKRLARQDALDEIVVGTGATFLGMTIGCARCHDHKFDPILQRDYYAMQAYFAGVHYGDRIAETPARKKRLQEAKELQQKMAVLKHLLAGFEPEASADEIVIIDDEDLEHVSLLKKKNGHGANPRGTMRGYKDDTGDAKRLPNLSRSRYTWWPNKPGVDVFTCNPEVEGRYRVWLSWGVHGSGVHTRDARYVIDTDGKLDTREDQKEIASIDQYYFAGVNKGKTERKPLWSGLYDAGVHDFEKTTRLVLRGGKTGTGISADVIVLQPVGEAHRDKLRMRAPVSALKNIEKFPPVEARFIRFTTFESINKNFHAPCIDELEVFTSAEKSENIALASKGTVASASGSQNNDRHKLEHVNDGRYGNGRSWIPLKKVGGWVQLKFAEPALIDRIEWARDREGKFKDRLPIRYQIEVASKEGEWQTVAQSGDRLPLGTPYDSVKAILRNTGKGSEDVAAKAAQLQKLKGQKGSLEKADLVYAGKFRAPDMTHMLRRGDPEQKGERVNANVPGIFGSKPMPADTPEKERRVALANWIASADNPLTARVMVNRVWQYHFGRGLVETPSDFGFQGGKPSHPKLLDWLATEFVRSGWSVKHMHRLILLSETYRQSNRIYANATTIDAGCRLLWRFPSRRLEGEAIRDSMLWVSGRLNLSMGGPGFSFFKSRGGLSGFPPMDTFGPNELRRMVYSHKIRMERVPVFGVFDCPDAGQPMPRRSQSTTAIQALNLFNSPFVIQQAEAFAERIREDLGNQKEQTQKAFELAVGRLPSHSEIAASEAAVSKHGLATLCRVLFNSNEFLFIP